MLKINKGEPIPEFISWVKHKKRTDDWTKIPYSLRQLMTEYILKREQNGLCGYTELPLKCSDRHIDHFRKQDWFPNLKFQWSNYVVASTNEAFGAKYKDNKSNLTKKDYDVIYNPVEKGMNSEVYYDENGWMRPNRKNDNMVGRTIEIFNLNDVKLREIRAEIIRQVDSYFIDGDSDNDIKEFLQGLGFPSVVEWELNRLKKQNTVS
ncbi:MAG: TIGR02646 family protein [Bacteroidales bacterium]|nr:TIGR02646 family protein [Bacteroidales bacterium]